MSLVELRDLRLKIFAPELTYVGEGRVFRKLIFDQFNFIQVVNTPGILDHPVEERNTIEMEAITALVYLRAIVVYFIYPSEQCGQTEVLLFIIKLQLTYAKLINVCKRIPFKDNNLLIVVICCTRCFINETNDR